MPAVTRFQTLQPDRRQQVVEAAPVHVEIYAGWTVPGERLEAMAGFFEAVTELHDQMKQLPTGTVRKLLRMGTKMRKKAG